MAQLRNYDEKRYELRGTNEGMHIFMPPSQQFPMIRTPSKVDPFSTTTVQEFPFGTELWYADRRFRYARCSSVGALTIGKLVQSTVPLAGHIDEAVDVPVTGDTVIAFTPNTVTTDDIAANALADGYIYINDDTGEGYMYRIKSHPALTGGASGNITLCDPLNLTLGASATATVIYPPYRHFILHPSPLTALPLGVTVAPFAASEYGWLQYQGPCAVLIQGTAVAGDFVVPSATVDGAVMPSAAVETDGPPVGNVIAVNADTEYGAIWLSLP
jgi:hypothetical protein